MIDIIFLFFIKQKTACEMRISDWSSDVCSSDLGRLASPEDRIWRPGGGRTAFTQVSQDLLEPWLGDWPGFEPRRSFVVRNPPGACSTGTQAFPLWRTRGGCLAIPDRTLPPPTRRRRFSRRRAEIGRASCRERVCQYV